MNHDLKRCSRGNKCLHPDRVEDGWLPRTEFHKDSTRLDGLHYLCQECKKEVARRWYQENPEKRRESNRRWRRENPFSDPAKAANQSAKKRGAPGVLDGGTLKAIYNTQEGRCFYCQADLELDHIDRHLDHMVPLAKGGTNYPENVVWACGFCNRAKNDHSAEEYLDWLAGVVERWPELRGELERRDNNAGGDFPLGSRPTSPFKPVFG